MAKITIPEDLHGKPLYKFLVENKKALINQKKSIIKFTEGVSASVDYVMPDKSTTKSITKAARNLPAGQLWVKVVANACLWCDSQMDVLVPNSSKKSISQRKTMIPHLHDHVYQLDAQIGDVQDVYLEDVPLRELGLNKSGATQCIIMETLLKRDYNPRVFDLYAAKKVNQHSIGLNYIQIELAINDEDSEKEYDFWNKYYEQVINKEILDEKGYFWVVSEIKLLENSGVLFGSNELTPTLETSSTSGKTASPASKLEPHDEDDWDLDTAIVTTRFF